MRFAHAATQAFSGVSRYAGEACLAPTPTLVRHWPAGSAPVRVTVLGATMRQPQPAQIRHRWMPSLSTCAAPT